MTSKDLKKYYPVLLKIADGAEWEFQFKHDGKWSNSGATSITAAVSLIYSGHEIRLKESDPYADLKAAHAAGKVIQCDFGDGDGWTDVPEPKWISPIICHYRIKPEPVMVPLGPNDVFPYDIFRCGGDAFLWRTVTGLGLDGVWIPHGTPEGNKFVTWEELQKHWEISPDAGKTWQRCEKEAVNP